MYELRHLTADDAQFYTLLGPLLLSDRLRADLGEVPVVSRPGTWVAAMSGGVAIGVAFVEIKGERAQLRHLWVDPQHRQRGIATQLLDARLALARRACAFVVAVAAPAWAPSLRAAGFQLLRHRGRYEVLRLDWGAHAG